MPVGPHSHQQRRGPASKVSTAFSHGSPAHHRNGRRDEASLEPRLEPYSPAATAAVEAASRISSLAAAPPRYGTDMKKLQHATEHGLSTVNGRPAVHRVSTTVATLASVLATAKPGTVASVINDGVISRPLTVPEGVTVDFGYRRIILRPASQRNNEDQPGAEGTQGSAQPVRKRDAIETAESVGAALLLRAKSTVWRSSVRGQVTISHSGKVGVHCEGGTAMLHGVSIEDCAVGVSLHMFAEPLITHCSISGCSEAGVIIDVGPAMRPVLENVTLQRNLHGAVVNAGRPWFNECTFDSNRNCGVTFEHDGYGALHRCTVSGNGTQGVYARAPTSAMPPIVFESRVLFGRASGIKVPDGGRVDVCRCAFFGNDDHDIDVESGGLCTGVSNRCLGGARTSIAAWPKSTLTLLANSFVAYTLWAVVAHEKSIVTLRGNMLLSDAVMLDPASSAEVAALAQQLARRDPLRHQQLAASLAVSRSSSSPGGRAGGGDDADGDDVEGAAGCSGVLLQRCRGVAEDNLCLGWAPGIERGRTAFCLIKCSMLEQRDTKTVSMTDIDSLTPSARNAIVNIAAGCSPGAASDADPPARPAQGAGTQTTPCAGPSAPSKAPGRVATASFGWPSPPSSSSGARVPPRRSSSIHVAAASHQRQPGGTAPSSDVDMLCSVLRMDTRTHQIDFGPGAGLTDAGVTQLTQVIRGHPALEEVRIAPQQPVTATSTNPPLTEMSFERILDAAVVAPAMSGLDLAGVPVNEAGLQCATRALEQNPRLRRLRVEEPSARAAGAAGRVAELREDIDFLCAVNTATAQAQQAQARDQLMLARRDDPSVTEIDLSKEAVSAADNDTVIKLMGFSLRDNTHVSTLHLDARQLTADHLRPIASVVRSARSVHTLTLANNAMSSLGGADVRDEVLAGFTQLTVLDVSNNRLSDSADARAFAAMFGPSGRNARGAASPRGRSLTSLDISGNGFGQNDVDIIVAAVPRSLSLHNALVNRSTGSLTAAAGTSASSLPALAPPGALARSNSSSAGSSKGTGQSARPQTSPAEQNMSSPRAQRQRVWQPNPLRGPADPAAS